MKTITMKARAVAPTEARAPVKRSTSYAKDKGACSPVCTAWRARCGVQKMVEDDQYCADVLTQLFMIGAPAPQTGCWSLMIIFAGV